MREIKFRAWDKSCNRMFNTITELSFGNNDYFKELFFDQAFHFKAETKTDNGVEFHQATSEDCILMQYTGLKDKNGKEIYEGDIVKDIHQVGIGARTSMITRESVYEIKIPDIYMGWSPDEFQDIDDLAKYTSTSHKQYGIEVIGNIYETPELVK